MKKIFYLLTAVMKNWMVGAVQPGVKAGVDLGLVTILNRFSNLTLDKNDTVFLPWDDHFQYRGGTIDPKDIEFQIRTERFSKWITTKNFIRGQNFRDRICIDPKGIWDELKGEDRKEFTAEVCVVHHRAHPDDKGVVLTYELCQNLHGIVLDIDNNDYSIPKKLDTLSYFTGTLPTLPYSFDNVFNSDFSFKLSNITKINSDGEEVVQEQEPFGHSFNLPNVKEHIQWAKVIKEVPKYWRFHSKGKYLVYVTLESQVVSPALRIFKKDESNRLELLKARRIVKTCANFDSINSEDMNSNTILLRCFGGPTGHLHYTFYKINIINEKIVMTETFSIGSEYQNCSKIFFDKTQPGFVPKMACVKALVVGKKQTRFAKRVVIFDIYDEPLEFLVNPVTFSHSIEDLREKMPKLEKSKMGNYHSVVRNLFFRKSDAIHVYINHEVYEEIDGAGMENLKEASNVMQLITMDGEFSFYNLFPDMKFNDQLEFCPTNETVVSFNRRDLIMRAHKNNTVYKMRTNYLENQQILKTYCLSDDSKFSILYQEVKGKFLGDMKMAAYCTKYIYKATTRLFYIQTLPILPPEQILIFCYDEASIRSYNDEKKLGLFYAVPALKATASGKTSYNTFSMRIFENTKENNFPKLKLDLTNTSPGLYNLNLKISNSLGFSTNLSIPIQVFCRNKIEFTRRKEIVESPDLLQSIIKRESELGIYDLKSRYQVKGSFLNAELQVEDPEIRDQVRLVLPVNYIGYFSGKRRKASYVQISTINDTIYSVNQESFDVYKLDIHGKEKQKNFYRYEFTYPIRAEILYFKAFHVLNKNSEKVGIFFTVTRDSGGKIYVGILEKKLDSVTNSTDRMIRRNDVLRIPIENSESFAEVEKFEIRQREDYNYLLMFSKNYRTSIEVHKIEKKKSDKKNPGGGPGEEAWQKDLRLQEINGELLGISTFFFNDFTSIIVDETLDIAIIRDTSILFMKICTTYGISLEFYDMGEMYRYCRLTKISCFQKNTIEKKDGEEFLNSECIVATEGAQMHKLMVTRKKFDSQIQPINNTLSSPISSGVSEIIHPVYKIQSVNCNRFFFFPFQDVPARLNLGNDYFSMGTESSGFIAIYDRHSKNRFPIGSIWMPYAVKTHIAFTSIHGKDYLVQTSERSSGKIYSLGDFYINFLNPAISLKNATLNFNSKLLLNEPGIPQKSTVLRINKKPKKVEEKKGPLDMLDDDGCKVILGSIVGFSLIVVCCLITKEEKTRKTIKKRMGKLSRYRRNRRVEKERREIIKMIQIKSMDDLGDAGSEDEAYGLVKGDC